MIPIKFIIPICLAIVVIVASFHATLHNNLKWWNTRTTLQKESSFYSEQAFYYRYAKHSSLAKSVDDVWRLATRDERIQYPEIVNPIAQFTVVPEFLIGLVYRVFPPEWQKEYPIIDFYCDLVHVINGFGAAMLFLVALLFSDSTTGAILTLVLWLFNHQQASRAWNMVPLRESFGIPFWLAQLTVLCGIMRSKSMKSKNAPLLFLFSAFNLLFFLSWQLAPFVSFVQFVCLFACLLFGALSSQLYLWLAGTQIALNLIVFFLQFQNWNLLLSLATIFLVVSCVVTSLFWRERQLNPAIRKEKRFAFVRRNHDARNDNTVMMKLKKDPTPPLDWIPHVMILARALVVLILVLALSVGIKAFVNERLTLQDDAHMTELLRAKFSDYESLTTKMYLRQSEFQTIDKSTLMSLVETGLLPASGFVVAFLLSILLTHARRLRNPVTLFHLFQGLSFFLLMALFMRLKVFLVPYLCLLASFLASRAFSKLWNELFPATTRFLRASSYADFASLEFEDERKNKAKRETTPRRVEARRTKLRRRIQLLCVLILFCVLLSLNLGAFRARLAHEREFRHPQLGELLEWIGTTAPRYAVFAAEMALTSQIALVTDRPVTNHPHYENAWMREKTARLYRVFLCDSEFEIARMLANLTAANRNPPINYLVIATGACLQSDKIQLTSENTDKCLQKDKFCELALQGKFSKYFRREFHNQAYSVFAVLPI